MPGDTTEIQLNLADTFFDSISSLTPIMQARTMDAIRRFRQSPGSVGRNLEKINNQMMSMRIDQAYRAILCEVDQDRNYLVLWVDHHDAAYQWAERRRAVVRGNILQVIRTQETAESMPEKNQPQGLFCGITPRQWSRIGLDADQLPLLAEIRNEVDLYNLKSSFHPHVFEAMLYIASGIPIQEVLELIGDAEVTESPSLSLVESMKTPESRQSIVTINNELDLENLQRMLNTPLDDWRLFLHASQRRIVEGNFDGPTKVVGAAGTGKTIVAIHRAKYIAEHYLSGNRDRVLVTTFTVNLAADIAKKVSQLCPPQTAEKIDVINLDKLIAQFFRQAYPNMQMVYRDEILPVWQEAMRRNQYVGNLSTEFFMDEWSNVMLPNRLASLSAYLQTERTGRGTRLSRKDKVNVWSIADTYKSLIESNRKVDVETATSMVVDAFENGRLKRPYTAVIVDEAQDFSALRLMFVRSLCPISHSNDLFIVGDSHQRIYRNKTTLSRCGIDVRGRSFNLRINYRTTEEIRRWATGLFQGFTPDDLDGQDEAGKGYMSLLSGPKPDVRTFPRQEDEICHLTALIGELAGADQQLNRICISLRTTQLVEHYKSILNSKGIRMHEVKTNQADDQDMPGVRIATMHRVKGLEFDHMIICAVNDGIIPLKSLLQSADDPMTRHEIDLGERSLLYVAATRAKKSLHVLSYGNQSKFIKPSLDDGLPRIC